MQTQINVSLKNIVESAIKNTSFYKEKYKHINLNNENFFGNLPILTKEEIRENNEYMLNNSMVRENLIIDETSGTTGLPLKLYKTKKESVKTSIEMWKQRLRLGVSPKDRFVSNFGSILKDNGEIEIPYTKFGRNGCLQLSMTHQTPEAFNAYLDAMTKFQPTWFHAVPSIVYLMAEYYKENNIQVHIESLKYIEASGEFLPQHQKRKIEEVFNVPVRNNYAAQEFYMIAFECEYGHMHILERNVYVEICNNKKKEKNGIEGDVIVTGLNNHAMPLIRYRLGDRGKILNQQCNCGNISPILELSGGRIEDHIKLPNGNTMHSIAFILATEWMDLIYPDSVIQLQAVQNTTNTIEVFIRKGQKWSVIAREGLLKKLGELISPDIEFVIKTSERPLSKGKFKHYIRNFK